MAGSFTIRQSKTILARPEWQRIGNQIDAAPIFARSNFVNVHCFLVRLALINPTYSDIGNESFMLGVRRLRKALRHIDRPASWRERIQGRLWSAVVYP
jgi:hypothetical protein